jgi:hypothetical protein
MGGEIKNLVEREREELAEGYQLGDHCCESSNGKPTERRKEELDRFAVRVRKRKGRIC